MEGQPQDTQQQTEADIAVAEQRYKTLGVRLDEGLHARLSFIAQLSGSSLADEIRSLIEARVQAAQDDPELVARAQAVNAEIEREAAARRAAIAGFFGQTALSGSLEPAAPAKRATRRKASGTESAAEQA